jgi:putative endonuclease
MGRYNRSFQPVEFPLLGRRSTVGQQTLTLLIGVRIPTSQPDFARAFSASYVQAGFAGHLRSEFLITRSLSRRSPRKRAKAEPSQFSHFSPDQATAESATLRRHSPGIFGEYGEIRHGPLPAWSSSMGEKRFVYILRSDADPNRHYVGLTSDIARRLIWHNSGPSGVTLRNRPWSVLVSVEFTDPTAASRFERYLKTGSGRAFSKRHFAPWSSCDVAGERRLASRVTPQPRPSSKERP